MKMQDDLEDRQRVANATILLQSQLFTFIDIPSNTVNNKMKRKYCGINVKDWGGVTTDISEKRHASFHISIKNFTAHQYVYKKISHPMVIRMKMQKVYPTPYTVARKVQTDTSTLIYIVARKANEGLKGVR